MTWLVERLADLRKHLVQRLRVEDAKRRLERTDAPVDEISWRVG